MMNNLYNGQNFGWGLGGGLMMLIFWVASVLFIVWLVKEARRNFSEKTHKKSALDILKERYAKGEINKQEFEERKKDLDN